MGGLDVFEQGLYGSSEMFINGFLELYRSGILKREVYPDEIVQRLVNEGKITPLIDKKTLPSPAGSRRGSPQPGPNGCGLAPEIRHLQRVDYL
jgi:acyl-CoA hydrolase